MAGFLHSENARLQRKIQDRENARNVAIADRELAVADRDTLWAHLALLKSGFPFAVASAPAFSDSKRNRSDSNSGLPSKRSRVSGDSSPLTPTWTLTRSARSKSSAGPTRSSPATRSADTVQKNASKPRDNILQVNKPAPRTKPNKSIPSSRSTLSTRSTRSASADNSEQSTESLRPVDPPKSTASTPVEAPAQSPSHEKSAGSTRSPKSNRSDTLRRSNKQSRSVYSKHLSGVGPLNSANLPPVQGASATSPETSPRVVKDQSNP